jgi:hypothetical protein
MSSGVPQSRIGSVRGAAAGELFMHNTTPDGRAANRAVIVRLSSAASGQALPPLPRQGSQRWQLDVGSFQFGGSYNHISLNLSVYRLHDLEHDVSVPYFFLGAGASASMSPQYRGEDTRSWMDALERHFRRLPRPSFGATSSGEFHTDRPVTFADWDRLPGMIVSLSASALVGTMTQSFATFNTHRNRFHYHAVTGGIGSMLAPDVNIFANTPLVDIGGPSVGGGTPSAEASAQYGVWRVFDPTSGVSWDILHLHIPEWRDIAPF